jgi:phosphotriesterase-related protein
VADETHPVTTVLGPRRLGGEGLIDAHAHIWVAGVPGGAPDAPRLEDAGGIRTELWSFVSQGGQALIDCQPPRAGRDASRLAELSRSTGVAVVACTGFHLPGYYPASASPWHEDDETLVLRFLAELRVGMTDADVRLPFRAGAIKAAHPGSLSKGADRMFAAAVAAASSAGVMLLIHTERGEGVEELAEFLLSLNMSSQDVVLCHIDKRPDHELHRELARAGFLLEYDTFLRPKYSPQQGVWPLIKAMVADGLDESMACGLDLADASMWKFGGGCFGMSGLSQVVVPGLRSRGLSEDQVRRLTGDNVRLRLQTSGRAKATR